MTIEVGMPVYRPSPRLEAVLTALAMQTYKDFYITIYNDTKPEETEEIAKDEAIVEKMRQTYGLKINLIQNDHNLGYMANMHQIFNKATGDILFLLADDDIVSLDCIELLAKSFSDPEVGCVSRPYYWFIDDFKKPVRYCGIQHEEITKVSFKDSSVEDIKMCMEATGQLSGLAFRRSMLAKDFLFVEDMFTAHVYPFLHIFKDHVCAYMPHPTVAVAITTSQCQNDIYSPSPMNQWVDLYRNVMPDSKYTAKRELALERHMLNDFIGLAQIKNYGTFKELWTEICNFVRFRKRNLLSLSFYVYAAGSIIIPRFILRRLTNWYKANVIAKKLSDSVDFSLFPFDTIAPMWKFPEKNERSQ